MTRWTLIGIQVKLLTASQTDSTAPLSAIPRGDIMNVSQELAMNMIAVPTMLSASPRPRCTSGWNFPQP